MRSPGRSLAELSALIVLNVLTGQACKTTEPTGSDARSLAGSSTPAPANGALELIPAEEAEATARVTEIISSQIRRDYPAGVRPARRDAHAKHHGCVRANFQVNDNLPPELTGGVFQPGQEYHAWIRFSNGAGKDQHDKLPDGRGMAIKLMGVQGPKLLDSEADGKTQDFLMINGPSFFVRNAKDYVAFSEASADGNPLSYFISLTNPLDSHLHEFRIASKLATQTVVNPLKTRYWSMTPYLLRDKAIKYSAKPCAAPSTPIIHLNTDRDYLRKAMAETLDAGSACFEFMVQTQSDPQSMPVEDPTIEWDESASPFRKVATIIIPKQEFRSDAQQTFCENLSLTPWHGVQEMRPLGGINRVRKVVYEAISGLRHDLNGVTRQEPDGSEAF